MFPENAPRLLDHRRITQANVAAVKYQLRPGTFEVGARIGNNPVSRAGIGRVAKVGDDRMGADRWIDPQVAKGRQERMSFGQLADARRVFRCGMRKRMSRRHFEP